MKALIARKNAAFPPARDSGIPANNRYSLGDSRK